MKHVKKSTIGIGVMLTGLLAGVGATTVALLKKKKREEVYHEAELKAMNELDDLMAESDAENSADFDMPQHETVQQTTFEPADEDDEEDSEPIQDIADEEASDEDAQDENE